jgi:lantibiotic modifying enzyme
VPLTGFAHGAAGISWALLKLYDATRDERYRDVAFAGIAYERSLFSAVDQNWRDLRWLEPGQDVDSAPCFYYWCHGSAGIGLGRLDALTVHRDEHVLSEIDAAVRTTAAQGFRSDHSLCHGQASAAELMMLAAQVGISTPPPHSGPSWGEAMVRSIRESGYLTGFPLGFEIPGLMMGIAGIGYGLLRLRAPERVPSVLLLEPPQVR